MATTTNYGWTTPNDTDLVKDGASAIRTLGSSVDTTTKNLNPETTTGDLAYRSATANVKTRLGIGTAGQVLTVASGVPSWATPTTGDIEGVTAGTGISGGGTSGTVTVTNSMATAIDAKGDLIVGTGADAFSRLAVGTNTHVLTADSAEATGLKWAAPAGGGAGAVFIRRSSFSGVANTGTTFDGVFTSTYKSYLVIIENIYAVTNSDDLQLQFRASAVTTTTGYYSNFFGYSLNTTLVSSFVNNGSALGLSSDTGDSTTPNGGSFIFNGVGNVALNRVSGDYFVGNLALAGNFGGENNATTFDGFLLKSSSSNITGTVAIYGLVTS